MAVILDKKSLTLPARLTEHATIGDVLEWAVERLETGRVLVRIDVNGRTLEGEALSSARADSLDGSTNLTLLSADRRELSLTMLGKLAALIEWLAPQHKDVAGMFERGETQRGLERLGGLLSAWQQIQGAYGNLARLQSITLKELPVHEVNGETVLNEFCGQLGEIETALRSRDFVLLSDILQYEMDGAIANWMGLLEATLGVVEPVAV